jgi:hypothetical protein
MAENLYELIQKVRSMQAVHLTTYKRPNPYMDGLYNGMEVAIALILNQEPKYLGGQEEFDGPITPRP